MFTHVSYSPGEYEYFLLMTSKGKDEDVVDKISHQIGRTKLYEMHETKNILLKMASIRRKQAEKHVVFVDVGAHVGWYSY